MMLTSIAAILVGTLLLTFGRKHCRINPCVDCFLGRRGAIGAVVMIYLFDWDVNRSLVVHWVLFDRSCGPNKPVHVIGLTGDHGPDWDC